MSSASFEAGGALTDERAAIYIERRADRDALTHLRAMDYLLVIEPRQQGKTSLINHLMCHPALNDVAFAYADVATPDRSTEATWYQTLCPRILRQLRGFIPREQWPVIPQNSAGWREFLCDVAMFAANAHRRVVIALDEIGAVTFPGATEFFSVLRDVYNSRQAEAEFRQLTFLLSGAFHPRDLIKDDKISPFNIAQRVRLDDFTLTQVQELVGKGGWSPGQVSTLAERIHYWTDGQPYLTQLLCSYLGPDATPADVEAGVERLRREDENHLPPILKRLNSDEKQHKYLGRILAGERIKFYPRENRRQAGLELLGVIKADAQGCCIIRNRLYLQVLGKSDEPFTPEREDEMTSPRGVHPSITIPQELSQQLSKGNVVLFVGAGLSIGAGLPDWDTLIRPLAERIGYEGDDLLKAAQFYQNRYGRHALISYLRDKLDTTGIEPTENHDLLVRLPIGTVFTTNFDDLLERAYRRAGRSVNLVVGATELPFWDESRVNLVKLHGTYDRPASIIITERDYNTIYRSNALIVQQLNALLATKTFLFVGYSMGDPDFNQIYDQLTIDLGQHQRRPYLVTFDVDEFTMDDLEQRGFQVISLSAEGDRNARLAEWLQALLGTVAEPTSEAVTASPSEPARLQPRPAVPQSLKRVHGVDDMNYERGLNVFKQLAEGTEWYQDFTVHEAALSENLRDERRYGPSEQTRRDRTRIADQLNALALQHLGISFNDLCLGKQPPSSPTPETKGNGTPTGPQSFYGTGNRWAVLVGVNEYDDKANYGQLHVCVKDAHAIRKQLVTGGFDLDRIRLLTDDTPELPTRDNILVALKAVADATEPDDLLLFYYSGHGDEDGGESYLVALNGQRLVLSDTAVRVSRVKEIMEEAPARAKVIVLDACHSGADIGGKGPKPMSEEFIRRVFEEAEGLAILASCKQRQVSYEWQAQERSVYTHFMLEALEGKSDRDEKGFVTVQDASRHVTDGVKLWASQRNLSQTPTLQYSVAGDIILVRYQ